MNQKPKFVVVHCAATSDNPLDASYNSVDAKEINRWHVQRGWKKIGYHYVIKRDGVIESGRSETEMGAHTRGHNEDSIGICYIGTKRPTPAQVDSFIFLYDTLKDRWGIEHQSWFGHYEFTTSKMCPGFSMDIFRKMLAIHAGTK